MNRNTDHVGVKDTRRQATLWFAGTRGFTDDEGYSWTPIPVGNITREFPETKIKRMVDCVNACAGIRNPAAIPQLIEAAKIGLHWLKQAPVMWKEPIDDLTSALAALDSPVPETEPTPTQTPKP